MVVINGVLSVCVSFLSSVSRNDGELHLPVLFNWQTCYSHSIAFVSAQKYLL